MPQLKPETISMTGLNLFQHLCNLARLATSAYDGGSNSEVWIKACYFIRSACGIFFLVISDYLIIIVYQALNLLSMETFLLRF